MKGTRLTGIQRHDKLKAESVTGGAGEGSQLLRPDSDFEEREKVSLFLKSNQQCIIYSLLQKLLKIILTFKKTVASII